jgi:hypothetical protein
VKADRLFGIAQMSGNLPKRKMSEPLALTGPGVAVKLGASTKTSMIRARRNEAVKID